MTGSRWTLSAGLTTATGSTLHDGHVIVDHDFGGLGVWYTEQGSAAPGLELGLRWTMGGLGYLSLVAHGSRGTSTASYLSPTGQVVSSPRDLATVGADVVWGLPGLDRGHWKAEFGLGPTLAWQRLESAGHPPELAATLGGPSGGVPWTQRTGTSYGALLSLDATYGIGQSTGLYAGAIWRGLITGTRSTSWSNQDASDIRRATGDALEIQYQSNLATAFALRFGVRQAL